MRDNRLKKLPKQIGQLSNLHGLILDNNNIKRLPKNIKNLPKLDEIWAIESGLSHKWITKLEQWLPECEIMYENVNIPGDQLTDWPTPKPKPDPKFDK